MANSKRVLIIGGGTFGLSAAYHLAKSGYTDVTVLEKGAFIPSPASAGNDLNKIIRAEYEDPFYAELALVSPRCRVRHEAPTNIKQLTLTCPPGRHPAMAAESPLRPLLPPGRLPPVQLARRSRKGQEDSRQVPLLHLTASRVGGPDHAHQQP